MVHGHQHSDAVLELGHQYSDVVLEHGQVLEAWHVADIP